MHAEAACKRSRDFPVTVGLKADLQTLVIDPAGFDPDPACSKPVLRDESMSTERPVCTSRAARGRPCRLRDRLRRQRGGKKKSDLEAICPTYPNRCALGEKPALESKLDDAHTAATLSTVMFTGAIVLIGGGVALYILSPEWKREHSLHRPRSFPDAGRSD